MQTSEARRILDTFGYLQRGLITSAQAADSGLDTTTMTRLNQQSIIRRVRRGVYILAGVAEDALTDIRAAWLAASPHTLADERLMDKQPIIVSHVSAASVLGLGDITPAVHTFSTSLRKQSSASDVRYRMTSITSEDFVVVEGLPVTSPLRTIVDLAKDHLDGDQLHRVIADAVYEHRVKISDLSDRLTAHAGNYGHDSGETLIAESIRRFPVDDQFTELAQFSAVARALRNASGTFEGSNSKTEKRLQSLLLKSALSKQETANSIAGALAQFRSSEPSRTNADFVAGIPRSFFASANQPTELAQWLTSSEPGHPASTGNGESPKGSNGE